MKYETNAKDDLISFLESVNVTETHKPGTGTALFDTTPGTIVYLYLRTGLATFAQSRGIAIACEPAKRAVIKWLENSGMNIWMFPEYQQDGGSNVIKVTADFDWPNSGFESHTDATFHIDKCMELIVGRANAADMAKRANRTIGASMTINLTGQSRAPR